MNPLVSVVIPAYNAARYLAEAIDSALGQTFADTEILVIDDGSTDSTPELLHAYARRVRCFRQENRGVYAARNRGVELARGKYVAFLDADDQWLPDKLAKQVEVLDTQPEFRVVHSDASLVDADGRLLKPAVNPRRQSRNGRVFDEFFQSNMAVILLSTVIMDRECFARTGPFDERHRSVQDQVFFLRLAWHYPIWFIPQPLVKYRLTPQSLSRKDTVENVVLREKLLAEFISEHEDYFRSQPAFLSRRWLDFNQDAAKRLLHAGQYNSAHEYFRRCALRSGPGLFGWAITLLPPPMLDRLRRTRRSPLAAQE